MTTVARPARGQAGRQGLGHEQRGDGVDPQHLEDGLGPQVGQRPGADPVGLPRGRPDAGVVEQEVDASRTARRCGGRRRRPRRDRRRRGGRRSAGHRDVDASFWSASAVFGWRAVATTSSPAASSWRLSSKPNPRFAPVTTTRRMPDYPHRGLGSPVADDLFDRRDWRNHGTGRIVPPLAGRTPLGAGHPGHGRHRPVLVRGARRPAGGDGGHRLASGTTSSSSAPGRRSRSSSTWAPTSTSSPSPPGCPTPQAPQFDHLSLALPDEDALPVAAGPAEGGGLRGHRRRRPRLPALDLLLRPRRHRPRGVVVGDRRHRPRHRLRATARLFADPNPVPAVAELRARGEVDSIPATRLVDEVTRDLYKTGP